MTIVDSKAIEEYYLSLAGSTIRCEKILASSAGNAFVVSGSGKDHILKIFEPTRIDVCINAISVLSKLHDFPFLVPKIIDPAPISICNQVVYTYEYVQGECLRDTNLDIDAWLGISSLLLGLHKALKSIWLSGELIDLKIEEFEINRNLNIALELIRDLYPSIYNRVLALRLKPSCTPKAVAPVHADLHPGNVILSSGNMVPIDFDTLRLASLEKAVAGLLSKVCELNNADEKLFIFERIIGLPRNGGFNALCVDTLLLCLLEKKLSELIFLSSVTSSKSSKAYAKESLFGLDWLLAEWNQLKKILTNSIIS